MNYEGRVLIRPKGGTLSASGDKISVKNADSCMVVIAMETDYLMDYKKDWKGESPPGSWTVMRPKPLLRIMPP